MRVGQGGWVGHGYRLAPLYNGDSPFSDINGTTARLAFGTENIPP
jgi:hypothetical protein